MSRYHFMLIVSTIATLGSLYFSEVRGFIPCPLCWWQRLFMYTTAFYLIITLFRNRPVDAKVNGWIGLKSVLALLC